MNVQALISHLGVKAFAKRILCWLARLNESQLNVSFVRPLVKRAAGELRAVVDNDGLWISALNRAGEGVVLPFG